MGEIKCRLAKKSSFRENFKSTYFDSKKLELIDMLLKTEEESVLQKIKALLDYSSNNDKGLSDKD